MKKKRAQLQSEVMTGETQDWTRETAHELYPEMPAVADSVWENILARREAAKQGEKTA